MNPFIQIRGLFNREVSRFFQVPLQTLCAPMVNTTLYLMIFGVNLSKAFDLLNAIPYLAFLIPGLIAMAVFKNAFDNATSSVIGPKYVNELQDLRTVPLTMFQISLAKSLASFTRGAIVGVITYLIGQTFFYLTKGELLPIVSPLALIYFLFTGGLAFGFLGTAIGMWARTFEHVGAVSELILLPLIYLGGVFFDLSHLPPFWEKISLFNPLFYMINGVRYGVLGSTDISATLSAIVTLCILCISYILAHFSLKKGARYLRY
jgi:ABC-2 type transport system permease protein